MTIPDAQPVHESEMRAHRRPLADSGGGAGALPPRTDARGAVLYDKVDRRLMDTFPASDAVAQY